LLFGNQPLGIERLIAFGAITEQLRFRHRSFISCLASGKKSALLYLFDLAQESDCGKVLQCCDVAFDLAVGGKFAEQTAHDLAGAGLG